MQSRPVLRISYREEGTCHHLGVTRLFHLRTCLKIIVRFHKTNLCGLNSHFILHPTCKLRNRQFNCKSWFLNWKYLCSSRFRCSLHCKNNCTRKDHDLLNCLKLKENCKKNCRKWSFNLRRLWTRMFWDNGSWRSSMKLFRFKTKGWTPKSMILWMNLKGSKKNADKLWHRITNRNSNAKF